MIPAVRQPLEGLVVLDLSRVLAGPYATQLLGDLGAEVWKVERPGSGDETRAWGPPFVAGLSSYFLSVNRNKRSAALDFRVPEHREALQRAAAHADVVVENFLPGALVPHGLDAATLRRQHPELVVCSITGFGQDGPQAMLPGYDAVMQGFVGLQAVTGEADRPPVKVGVAMIDVLTGVHAASAILAALVGRLRGAGGAHVTLALAEVGLASLVNVAQSALSTGQPSSRHGSAHPTIVPYQTFSAPDGDFVVAVGNDEQWGRLCAALGESERAGGPWGRNPERVLARADVIGWLAARFANGSRDAWVAHLRAARVPCGPVRDVLEAVSDPMFRRSGLVQPARLPDGTETPLLSLPWSIEAERGRCTHAPPRLGADTPEFMERFAADHKPG